LITYRKVTQQAKNVNGFWGTDRVRRAITKEIEARIGVRIIIVI